MATPASPLPASPAAVLVRTFGVDHVAEILKADSQKPFEREETTQFAQKFTAKLSDKNFKGMGGLFHLFGGDATATATVRFQITGEGQKRSVNLEEVDIQFTAAWGGEYFFYCPEGDAPPQYRDHSFWVLPMTEWCKGKSCASKSMSNYYRDADPDAEAWTCNAVKRQAISHVRIVRDGDDRPNVKADVVVEARPIGVVGKIKMKLARIRCNAHAAGGLECKNFTIDNIVYGSFKYAGIDKWVARHRGTDPVSAVWAGFFEGFIPERTTTDIFSARDVMVKK